MAWRPGHVSKEASYATFRLCIPFFGIDALALITAAFIGYALRLERLNLGEYWESFALFTGAALIIVPTIFALAGIYAQYWRYASFYEFSLLAFALVLAGIALAVLILLGRALFPSIPVVPLSVPLIFIMPALALTMLPRLVVHTRFSPYPGEARSPATIGC